MGKLLGVLLLVASVILTACQPVSVEQATADYCQSLQAFHAAVGAVQALDENSTIDEVEASFKLVETSYRELQQAGSMLTEAELDALDQAYDDLSNVSHEIEGSMTLGEAKATVDESVAAVNAAWEELYADAGCVSAAAQ